MIDPAADAGLSAAIAAAIDAVLAPSFLHQLDRLRLRARAAIGQRDYSLLMAMTILYAFAVAFLNVIVDVLYVFVDPRIDVTAEAA